MNTRILYATLAGGLVSYVTGWLIFVLFLMDNTSGYGSATGVQKTDMSDIWALLLGNFTGAFLLAFIFSRWNGLNTLMAGAKSGALIGFLIWVTVDLVIFGTTNVYSLTGVALDVVSNTVIWAAAGTVVVWVLQYKRSA